jgi:hypothetical protein
MNDDTRVYRFTATEWLELFERFKDYPDALSRFCREQERRAKEEDLAEVAARLDDPSWAF